MLARPDPLDLLSFSFSIDIISFWELKKKKKNPAGNLLELKTLILLFLRQLFFCTANR